MNSKKITAFLLALTLSSVSFYGCRNEKTDESESSSVSETTTVSEETAAESKTVSESSDSEESTGTADLKDGIIVNIAGTDITEEEYKYYFFYAKNYIDDGDESYWENDENGEKLAGLKKQTLDFLFANSTVYKIASDNSVELTKEDHEKIDQLVNEDILYYNTVNSSSGDNFDKYLKDTYCTMEVYKKAYERQLLESKTVSALYEEDFKEHYFKDYICTKYIQIRPSVTYEVDENNNPLDTTENFYEILEDASYTDEERAVIDKLNKHAKAIDRDALKATIPELIDIINKRLDEGESMDSLMYKYNMDTAVDLKRDGTYAGYYINKQSMPPEFCDVAFALEENERSDGSLFINGYGYFLIERTPFDEEYLEDYLISLYMNNQNYSYASDYEKLCLETQKNMKITFDKDYDSITIESLKK